MKKSKVLKGIGIFLCSILLLVGCGQKDVASSNEVKVEPMKVEFETQDFSNEFFETKYPTTWTSEKYKDMDDITVFMCGTQDPETNFKPNVSVQTFNEKFPDIDEYMKQLQEEVDAADDTDMLKNLKMEKITLSNGEAVKTTVTSTVQGVEVKHMQLHIFDHDKKDKYAMMYYINVSKDFDQQLEAVMYMADTFKFKK
ncbi:hypothetical protein [Inediibacterium massiliense]|uniref:hypothetical protein n=1 Tax=Inediibacterium massiliense TaxID=1658111 RepID=UPI0006B44990|nr:hypothetical protein [Inediibacterium massiliense]